MVALRSTSSRILEPSSQRSLSDYSNQTLSELPPHHRNKIMGSRQSQSSLLLFTQDMNTGTDVVIKKLCGYKDTRYHLETLLERQQCQLNALRRNKEFTPEIYIALAPLHLLDMHQGIVCIGKAIDDLAEEQLDPDAEYVLLIQKLPDDRRLDSLLDKEDEVSLHSYILTLVGYIANMHQCLVPLSLEESINWGSYEQLQYKLRHNLELFDFILEKGNAFQCSILHQLAGRFTYLKDTLQRITMQSRYRKSLHQRVAERRIKHCHGDLKSPHIWIMPNNREPIKILDAIDFNPMYSHIDALSDFALLVADIQARTKYPSLVEEMVDCYLEQTDQKNESAKLVLNYYIIEKAMICTAINILYEDLPKLGLKFLEVAESRLQSLCD
jgi:aminoglycoside phosphotransferase family enzyme